MTDTIASASVLPCGAMFEGDPNRIVPRTLARVQPPDGA
jgi:hypothetical protein